MKQAPAETIVNFLSFGPSHRELRAITQFSPREWQTVLRWMDDVGLSFYFLQRLHDDHATASIPRSAFDRLQQNFTSNRLRMDYLAQRFDFINQRFVSAGVRFAAIKGFSLVPQFCADAHLRHQGDFDYVLDEASLPAARQVLLDAGYLHQDCPSSMEVKFITAGGSPSRGAGQYSPDSPHGVELHLDIWDADLNRLPHIPKLPFLERAINHSWNGFNFPALDDGDAFLLQILHVCQHLFCLWTRMSWLLELGYFLHRRSGDEELWSRVEERGKISPVLRELVVIVTELVSRLFATPVPALIREWNKQIRPASRVWIEHYARRCVFSELPGYQFSLFPTAKFVLFLHREFKQQSSVRKDLVRKRLLPTSRVRRILSSIRRQPSLAFRASLWKQHQLTQRGMFHLLSGIRYMSEIPRWRWLNRRNISTACQT